jgi:hypothetical protein
VLFAISRFAVERGDCIISQYDDFNIKALLVREIDEL